MSLGSDPGIRPDAVQTFSWCLSATEQMRPRSCEKRSRPLRSILPPHCLARGHTGSLCGCRTRAALHWQMNGWRKSAHADTCARRRAKSDKKTGLRGAGRSDSREWSRQSVSVENVAAWRLIRSELRLAGQHRKFHRSGGKKKRRKKKRKTSMPNFQHAQSRAPTQRYAPLRVHAFMTSSPPPPAPKVWDVPLVSFWSGVRRTSFHDK